MSYLALARKWRPKQFSQVVGQQHVLTALENALSQNRLHHAYLFSGTRGVGKTSIGRLFAKGLNCEQGITATPCGQCSTCLEIEEGRSVDLLEIDAASRTKVEDTRELLDNVQYKPARNRFKVYLIDEVHMLSRHSFNALLKTLEEPPEYVKFLLATTDPQKLPVTILSRCLQFHLKPITVDTIQQQLSHVLEQEAVTSEPRALSLMAHAADGSMRDALSLTDQAIALGNGQITADTVSQMLGTLDSGQALALIEAVSRGESESLFSLLQQLSENGIDWDVLVSELASQLHRIAMAQVLPQSEQESADSEKVNQLASQLSASDVQLFYQIALKGRQDLPFSPSQRIAVEMTLLRMLAFRPTSGLAVNEIQTVPVGVTSPQVMAQVATSAAESVVAQPVQSASVSPAPLPDVPTEYGQSQGQQSYEQPYPSVADYDSPAPQVAPEQHDNRMSDAHVQPTETIQPVQPDTQPVPSAGGLRHQLRSKRQSQSQGGTPSVKKSNAPSTSSSVLERVAQRTSAPMPKGVDNVGGADVPQTEQEPYRWQPSAAPVKEESKPTFKPSILKKALEHVKTPEMAEKLTREATQRDEWAALIERLDISKLAQQLALNSVYRKSGNVIELGLRDSHKHLNSDKNQTELLASLSQVLGESCILSVTSATEGTTPLELREQIYQEKLTVAAQNVHQDQHVQFIKTRFAADLDDESIRPL
ncbi:DNA polymerase III subunit gamma/tau [Vibrio hippocampi]|uniref:DNA polymerase III subunit gamma/tau n=1 Tax=Vibrio hippocampi TaxID=654686 RepID=A0ABM8ZIR4_9VIBR|nr:DNA polymerase III subunit gamma/tau [Vibrio hippocampi]CAH0526559.1 hypothetical protein VHP8226_01913 [Vibrio hippocampi]